MQTSKQVLKDIFGFSEFRGVQEAIVNEVISGADALVLMPTGAGKSLCYQIPSLVRSGVGIVISPLIALMQDQVDTLTQLGVKAAFLNSSMDAFNSQSTVQQLLGGKFDLMYVAPERLLSPSFLAVLEKLYANSQIALFAIDEAHCVSQWGHDFRPEYRQLTELRDRFPKVPRIALTATADAATRVEIIERLSLESAKEFVSSFDRVNIKYKIMLKDNAKKQLEEFLTTEHPNDAGIVYCLSRKSVESTAEWLQNKGWDALPYHAGITPETRNKNQQRFLREEGVIMVATVAFGMGIDKPNVRFVAHLDLPKSMEGYYQETGRAGRDGLPANAWMAYSLGDVVNLRQMVNSGDAPEERKRVELQKLNALLGFCESTGCRHQTILRYFGEDHPGNCGNCDNCLEPVENWNATIEAQKALSCVYRTGQMFGVAHLIDVLVGKLNPKISQYGHDKLKTFGVGADLNPTQWSSIYRQLVAGGYLDADIKMYGGLKLADKARSVLKDEDVVWLRRDIGQSKKGPLKSQPTQRATQIFANASEQLLWDELKALRTKLATEQGVPPYVIFHDTTLLEILRIAPKSLSVFKGIAGVGQVKLEKYGSQFIDTVQKFK
jgi:ATP-dependent DNA helicase RecQ